MPPLMDDVSIAMQSTVLDGSAAQCRHRNGPRVAHRDLGEAYVQHSQTLQVEREPRVGVFRAACQQPPKTKVANEGLLPAVVGYLHDLQEPWEKDKRADSSVSVARTGKGPNASVHVEAALPAIPFVDQCAAALREHMQGLQEPYDRHKDLKAVPRHQHSKPSQRSVDSESWAFLQYLPGMQEPYDRHKDAMSHPGHDKPLINAEVDFRLQQFDALDQAQRALHTSYARTPRYFCGKAREDTGSDAETAAPSAALSANVTGLPSPRSSCEDLANDRRVTFEYGGPKAARNHSNEEKDGCNLM